MVLGALPEATAHLATCRGCNGVLPLPRFAYLPVSMHPVIELLPKFFLFPLFLIGIALVPPVLQVNHPHAHLWQRRPSALYQHCQQDDSRRLQFSGHLTFSKCNSSPRTGRIR